MTTVGWVVDSTGVTNRIRGGSVGKSGSGVGDGTWRMATGIDWTPGGNTTFGGGTCSGAFATGSVGGADWASQVGCGWGAMGAVAPECGICGARHGPFADVSAKVGVGADVGGAAGAAAAIGAL